MTTAQRLLKLILRLTGVALLLATPFIFLPRTWHGAAHDYLGFGPYPAGPIIDYLVRSVSAMYALSGVFCWLVSFDVRRYAAVIVFLGAASMAFGVRMTVVDLQLGLPWWWAAGEGPSAMVLGLVLIVLPMRLKSSD